LFVSLATVLLIALLSAPLSAIAGSLGDGPGIAAPHEQLTPI
jgi:hypothetical protein